MTPSDACGTNPGSLSQNAVEKLGGDLGGSGEHGAGIVLRADREGALRSHGAGIQLFHGAVDGDTGLGVAGEDRTLDRSRAAPARQERRMDVQPEPLGEQLVRYQQPVCAYDHRRGGEVETRLESLGLEHRDAEPLGDLFRRRRLEPAAPAARRVDTREQRRNVVPVRQPLEDVGTERRRRGDRDPGHC